MENCQRVGYPFIDDAAVEEKREPDGTVKSISAIHPSTYATIMEFKRDPSRGEPSSVETNDSFLVYLPYFPFLMKTRWILSLESLKSLGKALRKEFTRAKNDTREKGNGTSDATEATRWIIMLNVIIRTLP